MNFEQFRKISQLGIGRFKFLEMQRKFYKHGTSDHLEHNENRDYWEILLGKAEPKDADVMRALDFGCGKGRNVTNLKKLGWILVDGSDLSVRNIKHCRDRFDPRYHTFFATSGIDTGQAIPNYYDLVISTITLQHIPVHSIRKQILVDIFRVLKPNGLFSFQMSFGSDLMDQLGRPRSGYFEESINARGTNGDHDVRIIDQNDLVSDLEDIGFIEIKTAIRDSFSDIGHPQWIYIECHKPS
jgi:SAM-dependent methyltransferase